MTENAYCCKHSIPMINQAPSFVVQKIMGEDCLPLNGWTLYDFDREYFRMGFSQEEYRYVECWDVEKDEHLSPTYPEYVVVPASMTDVLVQSCSEFRPKKRLPVMTYYSKSTGASMW